MKSAPITRPALCAQRVGPEFAARIVGAGETALLAKSLLDAFCAVLPAISGVGFYRIRIPLFPNITQ
jgi:hypothetical protein